MSDIPEDALKATRRWNQMNPLGPGLNLDDLMMNVMREQEFRLSSHPWGLEVMSDLAMENFVEPLRVLKFVVLGSCGDRRYRAARCHG